MIELIIVELQMCNPVSMSLRVSIAMTMSSLRNTGCGYSHVTDYIMLVSILSDLRQ